MLKMSKTIFVAITGGTGAGKSTVCKKIQEKINGQVVCTDEFFKAKKEWNGLNKSALRAEELYSVLKDFSKNKNSGFSPFLKKSGKISRKYKKLRYKKIILVEGILAFQYKKILDLMDYRFYLDLPIDEQYKRRRKKYLSEGRGKEKIANRESFDKIILPFYKKEVIPLKKDFEVINASLNLNKIEEKILKSLSRNVRK